MLLDLISVLESLAQIWLLIVFVDVFRLINVILEVVREWNEWNFSIFRVVFNFEVSVD